MPSYGFEVNYNPFAKRVWVPADSCSTLGTFYPGQIVTRGTTTASTNWQPTNAGSTDGVIPIGLAVGAADTTRKFAPYGIVIGSNLKTDTANAIYGWSAATITSQTSALQLATQKILAEGMFPKGDPALYLLVELISPTTVIKGRFFQGAWGTAITKYTTTVAAAAGTSFTTSAIPAASAALNGQTTWYCTKGVAQGLYRMCNDASTTAHTFSKAWPSVGNAGCAAGDTYKAVACAQFGQTFLQFDAAATYIDNSYATAYTSNSYNVNVIAMDLSKDGDEYVLFQFAGDHFCGYRA